MVGQDNVTEWDIDELVMVLMAWSLSGAALLCHHESALSQVSFPLDMTLDVART